MQILDEIDLQIQRYLLVQVVSSALLALVLWVGFAWIGLENALFWACFGGVLHLVPYAGPTVLVLISALVAYVQFDTLQPVVMVVGITLVLVGVIGFLLVPWLTQRIGGINAVMSSSPVLDRWIGGSSGSEEEKVSLGRVRQGGNRRAATTTRRRSWSTSSQ